MIRAKASATLLLVGVLVVCVAAGGWKYFSDESAWGRMDRSLVRLQSSIRYEAIINVQSRLADADAATREYSSKWRLFPISHRRAAGYAERGIAEIGEALQWQRWAAEGGEDSEPSHLQGLMRYPGVFESIRFGCNGPSPVVKPSAVEAAFVTAGQRWIGAARSGGRVTAGRSKAPNLSKKYSGCMAAYLAANKAAAEKRAQEHLMAQEKAQQALRLAEEKAREALRSAQEKKKEEVAAAKAKEAARLTAIKAAWQNYWKTPYHHKVRIATTSGCIYGFKAIVDGHQARPAPGSPHGAEYFGVERSMEMSMACYPGKASQYFISVDGTPLAPEWSKAELNGVDWYTAWIVRPH